VVVLSVAAWPLTVEPSIAERTSSPAAAENAAPATKSVANVSATATRLRRDRGFAVSAAGTTAASSASLSSSHSSQARPWTSRLIKEFRRGIAFSLRWSGAEAATSTRILLTSKIRGPYGLT
jgi:hypothetical protein